MGWSRSRSAPVELKRTSPLTVHELPVSTVRSLPALRIRPPSCAKGPFIGGMSHLGILAYGLDLFDTQPGMQLGNNAALTRFSIEAGKMFRISGRLNTSELRSYSRKHCANCDCERYRCKVFYREAVRTHSPAVFQYRCPSGCEVVTIIWHLTGCHHNQEEVTVLTLEVAAPGRTAGMFGYGSSAGFEQLLRLYPWTLGDTGKSSEKPSLPGSASSGFREARQGTFIRPVLSQFRR
jgi:hypothetical protein